MNNWGSERWKDLLLTFRAEWNQKGWENVLLVCSRGGEPMSHSRLRWATRPFCDPGEEEEEVSADPRLWRLGFFFWLMTIGRLKGLFLSPEKIHRRWLGGSPKELGAPWVQHVAVLSSHLVPEKSQKSQLWLGTPFSQNTRWCCPQLVLRALLSL